MNNLERIAHELDILKARGQAQQKEAMARIGERLKSLMAEKLPDADYVIENDVVILADIKCLRLMLGGIGKLQAVAAPNYIGPHLRWIHSWEDLARATLDFVPAEKSIDTPLHFATIWTGDLNEITRPFIIWGSGVSAEGDGYWNIEYQDKI